MSNIIQGIQIFFILVFFVSVVVIFIIGDSMKPVPYNHNKKSIFAVMGVPDMTVIPYPDAEYLEYINNWGNQVTVKIQGNKTWQDLYNAAEIAINESGDTHHMFIELFVETDNKRILELWTGS